MDFTKYFYDLKPGQIIRVNLVGASRHDLTFSRLDIQEINQHFAEVITVNLLDADLYASSALDIILGAFHEHILEHQADEFYQVDTITMRFIKTAYKGLVHLK